MTRLLRVLPMLVACAVFPTGVFGQGFKPYPGAKVDEAATKEARAATGTETTIYTTADSFEKAQAFYKGIGKEYAMPAYRKRSANLRSGGTLQEAYFIFDGAADIGTSKSWIKIQRPYLGAMKMPPPPNAKYVEDIYQDVRDVTVIVKAGK